MTKFFLLAFGLVSLVSLAQNVIVEVPNNDLAVYIGYESNLCYSYLSKDNKYEFSTYSDQGVKNTLLEENSLYSILLSKSEKTILTFDTSNNFKALPIYFNDGKTIKSVKSDLYASIDILDKKINFNSNNEYLLVNKKDSKEINLLKDELYLKIRDFRKNITTKKLIKKFDLNRYVGENFINTKENLGCKLFLNFDESTDIISKSISKDYKNIIIYKDKVTDNGEILGSIKFDLQLPKDLVFLYSRNEAGHYKTGGYDHKFLHFADDLHINNFIQDNSNGDIYFYGIYGNESKTLNATINTINPKGFYIYKFDKSGTKIWESINPITETNFSKSKVPVTIFNNLFELDNNLCFTIQINELGDFYYFNLIDKSNGQSIKSKNLDKSSNFNLLKGDYDIYSKFNTLSFLKHKEFVFNSIIASNLYPKYAKYIKNLSLNKKVTFTTYFSKKGIWLVESEEKKYRKVLYFNYE